MTEAVESEPSPPLMSPLILKATFRGEVATLPLACLSERSESNGPALSERSESNGLHVPKGIERIQPRRTPRWAETGGQRHHDQQ